MKCYHHNDLDGRCAAAVVNKKFAEEQVEFIECDYKDEPDIDSIRPGEEVIIVDFSFPPEIMNQVLEVTKNVIWCDHHKTAQNYELGYTQKIKGIRDFNEPGRSGAECAWDFFFPEEQAPDAVKLTGSYDTWRHDVKGDYAFNEAMKVDSEGTNPASELWAGILNINSSSRRAISDLIGIGNICVQYRDGYCSDILKHYGYETEFHGLKCLALNVYRFGSQAYGKEILKYDAVIAYIHTGDEYTVSMYTEKAGVDVSAVCLKYGGGGHTRAAGFCCKEIPWGKDAGNPDTAEC